MKTLEKTLDNFSTQMLNSAINGINQAVATKQKEVNYWKNQAQALAAKYKACLYCLSDKDWIPEALTCKSCHQSLKEVSHA